MQLMKGKSFSLFDHVFPPFKPQTLHSLMLPNSKFFNFKSDVLQISNLFWKRCGIRQFSLNFQSIEIPLSKLQISFSRSSGPGGQNVNKVNTKVEIRFNLDNADWIREDIKERFRKFNSNKITKDGEFILTSEEYRTQEENRKNCIEKLQQMLDKASIEPKKRIATEVPKWSKEERKFEKKKRSEIKNSRKKDFKSLWNN